MEDTAPVNEDAEKEVEDPTQAGKQGWTPAPVKEKGHQAQNAFQGGGKGSSLSGETTAGTN
jgi:hypothetical protein